MTKPISGPAATSSQGGPEEQPPGPSGPSGPPGPPAAVQAARHAAAVEHSAGPGHPEGQTSGPPAAVQAARHAAAVEHSAGPGHPEGQPSGPPGPSGPPAAVQAARHAAAVQNHDLSPAPGAAPLHRMVAAQAVFDSRGLLRNGEQLLLTLIIPVLLLFGFSEASVLNLGHGRRVDFLTPGIIALAIMSTAFTSQAIATGFERRYGVLKRLGATPLSRGGLVAARTVTVLAVEVLQIVVITAVAFGLGWRPHGGWIAVLAAALLVLAGTAAFSGLGLLMAGTLRAEATLAAANLVYLMLLGLGGVMFPLSKFPAGMRGVLELLPISALSGGLRAVLQHGTGLPWRDLAILAVWAVAGVALAARTFRWD